MSNNKLSDNNLASELVENRRFFKPIKIEEIVIFMIVDTLKYIILFGMFSYIFIYLFIYCLYKYMYKNINVKGKEAQGSQ